MNETAAYRTRSRLRTVCSALLLGLLCLLPAVVGHWTASREPSPCPEQHAAQVVVETAARKLHLCREGQSDAAFAIAIGQEGVGKRREGDRKTPLGTYPLAKARPSASGLHRFMLIGYPTKPQRAQGWTGSAVGIHGPPRWAARANLGLSSWGWTLGCVAVGTDHEMDRIAEWAAKHRVTTISLL
ncbi:MAG: L,D-transpeptidase family protein [Myxococcales bacterium]|nr:L,D-transpeptidase family protein [Myxococcales bacterium]